MNTYPPSRLKTSIPNKFDNSSTPCLPWYSDFTSLIDLERISYFFLFCLFSLKFFCLLFNLIFIVFSQAVAFKESLD
jgi:hypothetical protein